MIYLSIAPMVTAPWPDCWMVQLPSHRRSWGQMRPQISGMVEVWDETRQASRTSFSADRRSQSGILFWSGQAFWQNGTPQSVQRDACFSAVSMDGGSVISPNPRARSSAEALERRRGSTTKVPPGVMVLCVTASHMPQTGHSRQIIMA